MVQKKSNEETETKIDLQIRKLELKKAQAELVEIEQNAAYDKEEIKINKLNALRELLAESRSETNEALNDYVYVPILTPEAQEIVAKKIIELVKQF